MMRNPMILALTSVEVSGDIEPESSTRLWIAGPCKTSDRTAGLWDHEKAGRATITLCVRYLSL